MKSFSVDAFVYSIDLLYGYVQECLTVAEISSELEEILPKLTVL